MISFLFRPGIATRRNRPPAFPGASPGSVRSGRRSPIVTAFLLCTLVAAMAAAKPTTEGPSLRRDWREMQTPNFVLFGDASERQMREVGDSLESLRSFLSQVSSRNIEAPVPTYIYVFKDKRSFKPYQALQPNGEPLDSVGFFSRRQHANYITIDGSHRDAMLGITQHEYVHFYLSYRMRPIPVWLNEGLAELYSTFEVVGNHANLGKIIPRHLQWLQQNELIPLLQLFAVDRDSPTYNESDRRGVFYAQSWLVVHYLYLNREEGPQQLKKFLDLQDSLPPDQAFTEAFAESPEEMQRRLRKYIRSSYFSYRRSELAVDDLRQRFTFRDMASSEAMARLGELLAAQANRRSEAEEHLQAALAENDGEIRAHVGLGLLETSPQGDVNAAIEHFATARSLAPQDRRLIFLHAQARARRGDPPKDLRQDFVKVVNAHPGFADAWQWLAWSWTGETEHLAEAIKVFEGAHRVAPQNVSYAENLLYYYDRSERAEDAEALMQTFFRPRGLSPRRADGSQATHSASQAAAGQQIIFRTSPEQTDPVDQSLRQANHLLTEEKYEAALAVYEEIVEQRPHNMEYVKKRDELRRAVAHNRFIEGYNEAVRLFGIYEWRRTTVQLEQLLAGELSDAHRLKAEKLLAQAKQQRQLRGDSGL